MENKRKYLVVLMGLLILGVASASWVFFYNGSGDITGYVISSSGMTFNASDMSMENLTASSSSSSKVETLEIDNGNGNVTLELDINTSIVDVNDSCNNTGDISVSVEYEGSQVSDGQNITIQSGTSEFDVTTSAVGNACPQSVQTYLSLS